MFEIGKKGVPEPGSRPDTSPARTESTAPRPSATGSREAAVIGPSIHIDGDVRGEEDLLIEGDVYAHSIYIDGLCEGDLYGSERVHIRKNAQVRGNVTSPRVSLEDGAKFKGSIEMDPQAVQSVVGRVAAAKSASAQGVAKPMASPAPKPDVPPVAKTGLVS